MAISRIVEKFNELIHKSAWKKYSYELYIEIGLTAEEVFFV